MLDGTKNSGDEGNEKYSFLCKFCKQEIVTSFKDIDAEVQCASCGNISVVPLPRVSIRNKKKKTENLRVSEDRVEAKKPTESVEATKVNNDRPKSDQPGHQNPVGSIPGKNENLTRVTSGDTDLENKYTETDTHTDRTVLEPSTKKVLIHAAGLSCGLLVGFLGYNIIRGSSFSLALGDSIQAIAPESRVSVTEAQVYDLLEILIRRFEVSKRTNEDIQSLSLTLSDPRLENMNEFRINVSDRIEVLQQDLEKDREFIQQAIQQLDEISSSDSHQFGIALAEAKKKSKENNSYNTLDILDKIESSVSSCSVDCIDSSGFLAYWESSASIDQ